MARFSVGRIEVPVVHRRSDRARLWIARRLVVFSAWLCGSCVEWREVARRDDRWFGMIEAELRHVESGLGVEDVAGEEAGRRAWRAVVGASLRIRELRRRVRELEGDLAARRGWRWPQRRI